MSYEVLQKILNLFEQYHSNRRNLDIDIDRDLLRVCPISRKIILDVINQPPLSKITILTNNSNTLSFRNNNYLCPTDQNESGSCYSSTCQQFHICREYLLNNCSRFHSVGKCTHPHSFFTLHNKKILEQYDLLSKNEDPISSIIRIIRLSLPSSSSSSLNKTHLIVQSINRRNITKDLIDHWLGEHTHFLVDYQLINADTVRLIFDDAEIASMLKDFIERNRSQIALIKKDLLNDVLSSNYSTNTQSTINSIEDQYFLNGNNNPHDSTTIEKTSQENYSNSTIPKSSSEYYNLVYGRGRGKQPHKISPSVGLPSEERTSSLNNQPTSNVKPTFSRRLGLITSAESDRKPSKESLLTNEKKPVFSQRLYEMRNNELPQQITTKSIENHSNATSQSLNCDTNYTSNEYPYDTREESNNFPNSLPRPTLSKREQNRNNQIEKDTKNSLSSNNDLVVNETNFSSKDSSISEEDNFRPRFVFRNTQSTHLPEKQITKPKQTIITYVYKQQFNEQQLCYLLGPGRQNISENDHCEILSCLPSGFCRVIDEKQGNDIEKQLYSMLPNKFNIDPINIDTDLALVICSSAAESIFLQNQKYYAIFSEPLDIQLNIKIIDESDTKDQRSPSPSMENTASSYSQDHGDSDQFSTDGKYHISKTGSSIDVILGDICQVPVDIMICTSTSENLRENVLRQAGPTIQSQYQEKYLPDLAIILDGGSTAARRIFFVPWKTEIGRSNENITKQLISEFVTWCISKASERNFTSLSFPPIGTGDLGLDPIIVGETMINTAKECLQQCKMNVIFVIYKSKDNSGDECYQSFRVLLNSCDDQNQPNLSTSTNNKRRDKSNSSDSKNQIIQRNFQSKRLLTLSHSRNKVENINLLEKSLRDLIDEQTIDLSLIESSFNTKKNLLIDICLKYNLNPCINLSRNELTICGDKDSCYQCFYNLLGRKQLYQYYYTFSEGGGLSDQNKFNAFISLKINEANSLGFCDITVKDDDQTTFNIDLNKFQVNKNKQLAYLRKKPFNYTKTQIPSSWSESSLMINIIQLEESSYKTLECVQLFRQTMSNFDWQIDRIDVIENFPLYVYSMNSNYDHERERKKIFFHGCSYSSVQSIIHYGFHSTNASHYGEKFQDSSKESICLTNDALNSHLYGTYRSIDGKHYMFAVAVALDDIKKDFVLLSNNDAHLALPTHLIVYHKQNK